MSWLTWNSGVQVFILLLFFCWVLTHSYYSRTNQNNNSLFIMQKMWNKPCKKPKYNTVCSEGKMPPNHRKSWIIHNFKNLSQHVFTACHVIINKTWSVCLLMSKFCSTRPGKSGKKSLSPVKLKEAWCDCALFFFYGFTLYWEQRLRWLTVSWRHRVSVPLTR